MKDDRTVIEYSEDRGHFHLDMHARATCNGFERVGVSDSYSDAERFVDLFEEIDYPHDRIPLEEVKILFKLIVKNEH